eukprot:TRINITY_DN15498_c0_g1_i4.p1 TRINITY_DN15498_c0_g1~~TRINITY_DN15498_c0_g1_i4.p1  ORF type:complete len:122 (+),score=17.56 TRINITY_DN15498_c0_g1_i4:39-368(+)
METQGMISEQEPVLMRQETHNETRPGDWTCKQCDHHNFARREVCRNCGCSKDGEKGKKPDWVCPICAFNNYGRNRACIKCGHIHIPVTPPTLNQPLRPGLYSGSSLGLP